METEPQRTPENGAGGLTTRRIIIIALGILLLGVMFYTRVAREPRQQRNPVPASVLQQMQTRKVPDFQLTDASGQQVSNATLAGRPYLAYFFFSTCPGPCMRMNQQVAKLRDALPADSPLRMVGFSVDPDTDTPEVLAKFGTRFGVVPDRWLMLTGERQKIFDLATGGFLLVAAPTAPEYIPTEGPVTHSTKMALVDKEGNIVQYFDGLEDDFPQQVVTALKVRNLDN